MLVRFVSNLLGYIHAGQTPQLHFINGMMGNVCLIVLEVISTLGCCRELYIFVDLEVLNLSDFEGLFC